MIVRSLALLLVTLGLFLSTVLHVSAAGIALTGDYRVAQFMDDKVGTTPGGDAVVNDIQLTFDGSFNFGHQTLSTAGGTIGPAGSTSYDLWAYDQLSTTDTFDRGAVSSDTSLLFLGDNDSSNNNLMLMVGAKNGTGMSSSSLQGDYFTVEIKDDNFSGPADLSTNAARMSATGAGQITYQTLVHSKNVLSSGSMAYTVDPTGVLSIPAAGNGVVSPDGAFFSAALTDTTDNATSMLMGLKLGSGYSTDQLHGEYVYQEIGRSNGESYTKYARVYFFGNGSGLYVEEYNSATFTEIRSFRYMVSSDGMLYVGNEKFGAIGKNGELLLLTDTDASDGDISVGIALQNHDATTYFLDYDNDGMPVIFETTYGMIMFSPVDKYADADADGISNYYEFLAGSDPTDGLTPTCPTLSSSTGLDPTVNASGEILRAEYDSGSGINRIVSSLTGALTSGSLSSDSPSINNAGTAVWIEDGFDIVKLVSGAITPTYVGFGDEAVIADSGEVFFLDMDEIHSVSGGQKTSTGTWKYSIDANSRGDLVWSEQDAGVWKIMFQAGGSSVQAEVAVSTSPLDYPSINDAGEIIWSQKIDGIYILMSNVRGMFNSTSCLPDVNYIQADLAVNGGLAFFIYDAIGSFSGIYKIAGSGVVIVDTDGDGIPDSSDNCPLISNAGQLDANSDGVGDVCDSISDTDGDGVVDSLDDNPLVATRWQTPTTTTAWADYSGNITINAAAADIGDELAIYDPNGVLCGHTIVTVAGSYGPVNVYGDDPTTTSVDEGAVSGDLLTFKIWDDSAQVELNVASTPATVNWNDTDSLLVDFNGSADVTVTIPLNAGWNLISLPVNNVWYFNTPPTVDLLSNNKLVSVGAIKDVFNSIAGDFTLIRSFDSQGSHTYNPALPEGFNTLKYISGGYGYWINMSVPANLVVSGTPLDPSDSLPLKAGWNQVGCWGNTVQYFGTQPDYAYPDGATFTSVAKISDVLQLGTNLILMRSFDSQGSHTYNPALPEGFNTLKYMGPGYSYWINVSVDAVLDFDGIP